MVQGMSQKFSLHYKDRGDTWWHSWLRHCATNQKVAGSIPCGFTENFHWYNPSSRTMALGSTRPQTEMSTRNISWGWRRLVHGADDSTTLMCRMSWNLWVSTSWHPQSLSRLVMGLLYLYLTVTTSDTLRFNETERWKSAVCVAFCKIMAVHKAEI
jgi:hypothetical protein